MIMIKMILSTQASVRNWLIKHKFEALIEKIKHTWASIYPYAYKKCVYVTGIPHIDGIISTLPSAKWLITFFTTTGFFQYP